VVDAAVEGSRALVSSSFDKNVCMWDVGGVSLGSLRQGAKVKGSWEDAIMAAGPLR
jgi:hypothetical protein